MLKTECTSLDNREDNSILFERSPSVENKFGWSHTGADPASGEQIIEDWARDTAGKPAEVARMGSAEYTCCLTRRH
jgi:hypothetical protein